MSNVVRRGRQRARGGMRRKSAQNNYNKKSCSWASTCHFPRSHIAVSVIQCTILMTFLSLHVCPDSKKYWKPYKGSLTNGNLIKGYLDRSLSLKAVNLNVFFTARTWMHPTILRLKVGKAHPAEYMRNL